MRFLVPDPDDVTASAIRGAATWLLFQTSSWGSKEIESTTTADDTAVTWWRRQTISWGLADVATRAFRQWADDNTTRIMATDAANDYLLRASINAHIIGEQGAWRHASSLLARHSMVTASADEDVDAQAEPKDKSLLLAVRHLWSSGPLSALQDVSRDISEDAWTHSTAKANLALWRRAGDVLPIDVAEAAVERCLSIVSDHSAFARRTTPSFDIDYYVLRALRSVLCAANDAQQARVLEFIGDLSPVEDQADAQTWAAVVQKLRKGVATFEGLNLDDIRLAALRQPRLELSNAMLGKLATIDAAANNELTARARGGDDEAVAALGDVRRLDARTVGSLIERDVGLLARIVADATSGTFSMWSHDPAQSLVVLGRWFPELARWDVLLSFLSHPGVAGQHKRRACLALASSFFWATDRDPG